MFRRERNVQAPPQTWFAAARRGSAGATSRKPGSDSSFITTVARSSRSDSTSVSGARGGLTHRVTLPLTLFEYGFARTASAVLTVNDRFQNQDEVDFLNSPAGRQLRDLEHEYGRTLRQYISRSVPLAGSRILVLGCGAPASLLPILERGVAEATFVDTSRLALDKLSSAVEARGTRASLAADYVQQDAWEYLQDNEEAEFDFVLATKCVGLILAHGPGRTAQGLFDLVVDVLAPGGSFITDHHAAFAGRRAAARPISVGLNDVDYTLATVAGRYAADVGYSWHVTHPDASLVARFCPRRMGPSRVQEWHIFHFRVVHADGPRPASPISARRPPAPTPFPLPPLQDFDPVRDAMVPVNHKGNKRIPAPEDLHSFDIARTRPKVDGVPGILVIDGRAAAFMSSTRSTAHALNCDISPPLVLTAELVATREHDALIVCTGLMVVGQTRCDPNDDVAFRSVSRVLDKLGPVGIIASGPDLMRSLRGDALALTAPNGRAVTVPVDGVTPIVNGRYGTFLKVASSHTVDSTPAEVDDLLHFGYTALGYETSPPVDRPPDADPKLVYEYSLTDAGSRWTPVRRRDDKTRSDTPGAVVHTVCAALASSVLGVQGTVQEMVGMMCR
nr:methyl transferase